MPAIQPSTTATRALEWSNQNVRASSRLIAGSIAYVSPPRKIGSSTDQTPSPSAAGSASRMWSWSATGRLLCARTAGLTNLRCRPGTDRRSRHQDGSWARSHATSARTASRSPSVVAARDATPSKQGTKHTTSQSKAFSAAGYMAERSGARYAITGVALGLQSPIRGLTRGLRVR